VPAIRAAINDVVDVDHYLLKPLGNPRPEEKLYPVRRMPCSESYSR